LERDLFVDDWTEAGFISRTIFYSDRSSSGESDESHSGTKRVIERNLQSAIVLFLS